MLSKVIYGYLSYFLWGIMLRRTMKIAMVLLAVLSAIALSFLGVFLALWMQRPIIYYEINGLPSTIQTSDFPITVHISLQNRGALTVPLQLTIRVPGEANVTVDNFEPWMQQPTLNQLVLNVNATGNMENAVTYPVKIYTTQDEFTIQYRIQDASDASSLNGMISHNFLEEHPADSVYDRYTKGEDSVYQLTIQGLPPAA